MENPQDRQKIMADLVLLEKIHTDFFQDVCVDYFLENPIAVEFILGVNHIVSRIYEGKAKVKIDIQKDHDFFIWSAKLKIYSKSLTNDEILSKNNVIFYEIEIAGLSSGFNLVVLT